VPGNEAVNGAAIAEEMARLTKENAHLCAQSQELHFENGLTYQQIYELLEKATFSEMPEATHPVISITDSFNSFVPSVLHGFWAFANYFRSGFEGYSARPNHELLMATLKRFESVSWDRNSYYHLSEDGVKFSFENGARTRRQTPPFVDLHSGKCLACLFFES
jgi:hypothetical protein